MARLGRRLERHWYTETPVSRGLLPLAGAFRLAVSLRRRYYNRLAGRQWRAPVPVIVVGNLTIGGTGKTPLVMWLAELLKAYGYRPGIISRGYGGRYRRWPLTVGADSDPAICGDEPVLMAARTACSVAVGRDRVRVAAYLIDAKACNIVLSDDGLQHYSLYRDLEILVVDGQRRFGNGYCLPAGPLREPLARLKTVDGVVFNGGADATHYAMRLQADRAVNLARGFERRLEAFLGGPVHAVAAIGNPQRFFDLLTDRGLTIQRHVFPDHHRFVPAELDFDGDLPVLMTAKDAVKCRRFGDEHHWYVPVDARLSPGFDELIIDKLEDRHAG